MVGNLKVVSQIRQTHIRFRIFDDFEYHTNSIDEGYDAEVAVFIGYKYKINTPQFNSVNTSQYGNVCDLKHEISEYRNRNCFIPTKGFCFVKCINFLTGEYYEEQYIDFIRNEKKKTNTMTKSRI